MNICSSWHINAMRSFYLGGEKNEIVCSRVAGVFEAHPQVRGLISLGDQVVMMMLIRQINGSAWYGSNLTHLILAENLVGFRTILQTLVQIQQKNRRRNVVTAQNNLVIDRHETNKAFFLYSSSVQFLFSVYVKLQMYNFKSSFLYLHTCLILGVLKKDIYISLLL